MKDKIVMYFITMVCKDLKTMKCVGYYKDFDYAIETLVENRLDLNETIYDYAMIEEIRNGLYADDVCRWWFKFDYNRGTYEGWKTPEQYEKKICAYSLR
jgi:hypothetical protein